MDGRRVGGHPIDLLDVGAGLPVLMLHGFGLDKRSLAYSLGPLFERRAGYRRIHVDLPGFGASPAVPAITSSQAMVDASEVGLEPASLRRHVG